MGLQLTIGEIASAFEHTYDSIDIRTVAIRESDQWLNVLTVIRLGHHSSESVEAHYKDLKRRYVDPKTDVFQIFLTVKAFSKWNEFCFELSKCQLRHGDQTVQLNRPIELQDKLGYVADHHGLLRNFDGESWPSCEIHFAPNAQPIQANWDTLRYKLGERKLTMQVSSLGYSTSFDAIDAFLEFGRSYNVRGDFDLYVSAPLFAKIETASISSTQPRVLTASARIHGHLPGPRLFAILKDVPFQHSGGLLYKANLPLLPEEFSQNDDIRIVRASVTLPESATLSDYVDVKVSCSIGEIHSRQNQLRELIPFAEVSPLYKALGLFCSPNKLRAALTLVHSFQLPKNRRVWQPQNYFERHICWLLSCFGFACLMLGEHESLQSENAIQRGSVDILAFHPKRSVLLVVACTMNAPKEEDFHNLLNIRDILKQEAFPDVSQHIGTAVFTGVKNYPSEGSGASENPFMRGGRVPVLDAEILDKALNYLSNREEEKFFSILSLT